MISRKLITLLFVAACFVGANAQAKLKSANKKMQQLNYIQAIELYNQVLEKNDVAEAKINIAEAYRKIGDSGNAEFWYGQVVRLPEAEPVTKLYYGQMLQRNGKCELAREWYNQYIEAVPDDLRGQYLSRACDYEQELMTKAAGIYEVKHLDFNSDLDDFAPNYFQDGIVFSSDRDKGTMVKRDHGWTGHPFLELYYSEAKETKKGEDGLCGEFVYARPEKWSDKINSKYHDAGVTFSPNGSEVFFTRNNLVGGKTGRDDEDIVRLKVLTAKSTDGGKWSELESLPFNSDEYSVAHPALSPDGNTLYFASDMPGGFGSMDIYMSKKESGRWGPPTNLGPTINTEGIEIFPFVDMNNRLYYSSDGLIGLGGFDVFYSNPKDVEGEWNQPENVGYPINTISDDLGIVFDKNGTCGYFASARAGGVGGDDIYSFRKVAVPVKIFVFDEATGQPIAGATVVDDCLGRELITGEDGTILIDMKLNTCCNFEAESEGYANNSKEGCTQGADFDLEIDIPLESEVLFTLDGIVFDDGTGLPMAGATVTLINDCEAEEQELITDESGRFSFELPEECSFTLKGAKQRYLTDMKENIITTVGLTEAEAFNENLYLQPTVYGQIDPNLGSEEPSIAGGDEPSTSGTGGTRVPPPFERPTEITPPPGDDPSDDDFGVYKGEDGLTYIQETGDIADGFIGGKLYIKGEEQIDERNDGGDFIPGPEVGEKQPGEPIAYLLHIYYDFDQAYIRPDAEVELEELYSTMINTPDIIVEIGSHTDARGTKTYNKRLSQRRADAVVKWLVGKGIERDRLVPVGYGETLTVNNCKDFIPCTERDHQLNRRTEFRVIGCKGCVEEGAEVISAENKDVIVDECAGCPF